MATSNKSDLKQIDFIEAETQPFADTRRMHRPVVVSCSNLKAGYPLPDAPWSYQPTPSDEHTITQASPNVDQIDVVGWKMLGEIQCQLRNSGNGSFPNERHIIG